MYRLNAVDPQLSELLTKEMQRQHRTIELIASENFVPPVMLEVQGSVLTNKYAEGYPGRRYHGGCHVIDEMESLAIERAKRLFGAEYANVQPHSGVNANMAVYMAVLKPGDTILGMDLSHGGHLSHGSKVSISGVMYASHSYGVNRETETIDYDEVARLAEELKPRMIIAGASAYPRIIDFARFRAIADSVGALFMVDMAHIAGLVAAGVHPSPVPYADFVTSTTTKTMRGARGGIILCKAEYGPKVDKAIFPGIQGGPILQNVAAKALTFKLAMTEEFRRYQRQVAANAKALSMELAESGFRLVSGGTDNHLMLVDCRSKDLTGRQAEESLEEVGIAVNKNMIPYDPAPPAVTSGVRLGAAAMTGRGMREPEFRRIGQMISEVLTSQSASVAKKVKAEVDDLCNAFPLYFDRVEAAGATLGAP